MCVAFCMKLFHCQHITVLSARVNIVNRAPTTPFSTICGLYIYGVYLHCLEKLQDWICFTKTRGKKIMPIYVRKHFVLEVLANNLLTSVFIILAVGTLKPPVWSVPTESWHFTNAFFVRVKTLATEPGPLKWCDTVCALENVTCVLSISFEMWLDKNKKSTVVKFVPCPVNVLCPL